MAEDIREEAAKYYDAQPNPTVDIPFYRARIPSPLADVLELGCGTGRVLVPLADACRFIHGIDSSEAMLARCREKLKAAGIAENKAQVTRGGISDFDLGRRFDLIIAPFRVFQNLETDEEVDGLFECVHRHLAPGGSCILNVFNPKRSAEEMRRTWCVPEEVLEWEKMLDGGRRLARFLRRPRMDTEKMIVYPELVYRRYDGDVLEDEAVLKIAMRCYYPDEFAQLVTDHGFTLIDRWGGYAGEPYGQGPELVLKFSE